MPMEIVIAKYNAISIKNLSLFVIFAHLDLYLSRKSVLSVNICLSSQYFALWSFHDICFGGYQIYDQNSLKLVMAVHKGFYCFLTVD